MAVGGVSLDVHALAKALNSREATHIDEHEITESPNDLDETCKLNLAMTV